MGFIQQRKDGTHNVVIFRYAALFYWLVWPTIILTILTWEIESRILPVATGVAWVLLIASAVPYWPAVFKLKRTMKEKGITAKGSKYSFSNPLTYEWDD